MEHTNLNEEEIKFVAGQLCLDFVNTVDAWADTLEAAQSRHYGDTPLREKLVDYEALVRWGQQADLLGVREARHLTAHAAQQAREATRVLTRARRLRLALYRIFKALFEHWEPEDGDTDVLQAELKIARLHEHLVYRAASYQWVWDEAPEALDRMLWSVSRSAAELLTSGKLRLLRQCKGEDCGWLFLDTSRNHSRQWCDMNDCGNLAKVRRFRVRSKIGAVSADVSERTTRRSGPRR